jgi:hypothetical protein
VKNPRRLTRLVRRSDLRDVSESVLRAFSLVVTDRRWAAPLSAMALGFGLFLGVAIGPGAEGSQATGAGQIIAVAAPEEKEPEARDRGSVARSIPEAEPSTEPEPLETLPEPEYAPAPLAEPATEDEASPSEEPAEKELEEEAETQLLRGIVVHANPAAGSYAMAIAGGELVSVHAPKLPLPGEKLEVEAVPLANNTFGEVEHDRSGSATGAKIRGAVTHVDPDPTDPTYTLSGRGSSILVHVQAAAEPQVPELGAYATAEVRIEKPPAGATAPPEATSVPLESAETCVPDPALKPPPEPKRILIQRSIAAEPEPATYVDLAGIVTALCPDTEQLLLSADDLRTGEKDLLLAVPPRFRTDELKVGESVVVTANLAEDGTLTLAGLASDEGRKGAEDAISAQGDLQRR